jgi:sortase A
MSRRRLATLGLAGLLVALGGWQVGAAGWIHAKAWLAQGLLETAWQRTLATGEPARPWPWADTWPVARLAAPAHGVELIVLAGGSGRTLAFAPGHLDGSPLPGRPGTSIIGGHRDTHFRFLERVRPGDELVVDDAAGARHRFRVSETRIVDSRTARIEPAGTRPALVLVTCYPFDALVPGGPLRYLVIADSLAETPAAERSGSP